MRSIRTRRTNRHRGVPAVLLVLAAFGGATASAATLVVDDNLACPGASYATIQAAVNAAAPGDTIQVCAGNYSENVTVPKTLTINGAQAGQSIVGRVSGGPNESTVTGASTVGANPVFLISAPDVTLDGFSVKNPGLTSGAAIGVSVKTAGDNAALMNNFIDLIITTDPGGNGTAQAIYLENGPDNVEILGNGMSDIHSNRSAKGVTIGDGGSANPSTGTRIQGNVITNVTSETRGAYGISVNNGNGSNANSGLEIRNNTISDLSSGGWVHAIGLETNTPGVIVDGNDISNLSDSGASDDNIAVWFEANPSFSTAQVNNNNFNLTAVSYGIAVHPALVVGGGSVNGACNYWGAPNGPGPVGPGAGARVSPNVTYSPWRVAKDGACGGAVVTNKDQCKNGGWMTLFRADGTPFKNQGDCVSYVNTGK